ncbi:Pycsar system effector family protein [Dyadobacter tibetensis]|uniref:Pycsar system effector family protein n=1 Tax=Dyadobacter tibetensis TaxID=1211851 RepID=UPI0004715A50|nr:Pycsar system effector family protein [Dyadobacter tibetensis]
MDYSELLILVENEVVRLFEELSFTRLEYHNLSHTRSVVESASKMAVKFELSAEEVFIVKVAAWFHDTGYFNGDAEGHEERGAKLAAGFLDIHHVPESIIAEIKGCILATKLPQSPQNLLQQIVCDADLYHFGTTDFMSNNKLMRKEAESRLGRKISKSEWNDSTIKLLKEHTFKTSLCQQLLGDQKRENLNSLKAKGADKKQMKIDGPRKIEQDEHLSKPGRGIETMFRVTSSNHQRLSDMADNKAHIMITTTSIIISVLLSVLFRMMEETPHLIIPTATLLIVCVITMVFSILATRPQIPNGTFSKESVENKSVNLLFFGNFYRMPYEAYYEGMQRVMNDKEFLYGNLTKDVYSQGVVLGRKYRLLRVAYNIFMFGIVVSVLCFVVAAYMAHKDLQ